MTHVSTSAAMNANCRKSVMRFLLVDWGENKTHIFASVRQSLEAGGHSTRTISRSSPDQRASLVEAIRSGHFDALVTWQRFYPMQRDILQAIADSRVRTVFMDFGFVPHYHAVVFDSAGENAVSSWPGMWGAGTSPHIEPSYCEAADALMRERAAEARLAPVPACLEASGLRLPFIFVPLQRPRDSVVRYDSKVRDLVTDVADGHGAV